VSGLGVVNVLAAIAELVDIFLARGRSDASLPEDPSGLSDHAP
jgi:hypothetical protein